MKYKEIVEKERKQKLAQTMVSMGLWLRLDQLADSILGSDASGLTEFQQLIRYAPDEMRLKLLEKVDAR